MYITEHTSCTAELSNFQIKFNCNIYNTSFIDFGQKKAAQVT